MPQAPVVVISTELAQQLVTFLATKPYAEVHQLIASLVQASQATLGAPSPGPRKSVGIVESDHPDDGKLEEEFVATKT